VTQRNQHSALPGKANVVEARNPDQPILRKAKYLGSYPEVQVRPKGKIVWMAISGCVSEIADGQAGRRRRFDTFGRADYRSKFIRKRIAG
jgi:hypothetical protein